MSPTGIVLAERYMKFRSLDEAQHNPGAPGRAQGRAHYSKSIPLIGGIPRIPAFGLHPGYTCYMEITIHGTP